MRNSWPPPTADALGKVVAGMHVQTVQTNVRQVQ